MPNFTAALFSASEKPAFSWSGRNGAARAWAIVAGSVSMSDMGMAPGRLEGEVSGGRGRIGLGVQLSGVLLRQFVEPLFGHVVGRWRRIAVREGFEVFGVE